MIKKIFKVILFISTIVVSIYYANFQGKADSLLKSQSDSWMSMYLKDNTELGEVSVPGTHDSAAYKMNGLSVFATPWAKTQDWNISDQLATGIRYLDLRVFDDMTMHHGIAWVGENLEYHLNEICQFLDFHPKDFIFIRLRAEQDGSDPLLLCL